MRRDAPGRVGYRLVVLSPELENGEQARDRKISLLVLIGSCILCIGLTAISPARALWVYVLNVAATPLARCIGRHRSARRLGKGAAWQDHAAGRGRPSGKERCLPRNRRWPLGRRPARSRSHLPGVSSWGHGDGPRASSTPAISSLALA
jgi:hypothetical protein